MERVPIPIFEYVYNDEKILAMVTETFDNVHLIYYVNGTSNDNNFLSYTINNKSEEVELVKSVKNSSRLYSPIIKISNLPGRLKSEIPGDSYRYVGIGLEDLFSLSNVVAYKTIYEEFSIPLFFFPIENHSSVSISNGSNLNYMLGTMVNLFDDDENTFFYYVLMDYEVDKNFLKFSSQTSNKPTFSNNINEHGFLYFKIIRLGETHPLVGF